MATVLILHGFNDEHLVWPCQSVKHAKEVLTDFEYDISDAEIKDDDEGDLYYTKFEGKMQQCTPLNPTN